MKSEPEPVPPVEKAIRALVNLTASSKATVSQVAYGDTSGESHSMLLYIRQDAILVDLIRKFLAIVERAES